MPPINWIHFLIFDYKVEGGADLEGPFSELSRARADADAYLPPGTIYRVQERILDEPRTGPTWWGPYVTPKREGEG